MNTLIQKLTEILKIFYQRIRVKEETSAHLTLDSVVKGRMINNKRSSFVGTTSKSNNIQVYWSFLGGSVFMAEKAVCIRLSNLHLV